MFLARARMCDIVSSAVDTVFPPGVFITSTPFDVAAGTLMLSTPTPSQSRSSAFSSRRKDSKLVFRDRDTKPPFLFHR